jgi:IS30 family transposase
VPVQLVDATPSELEALTQVVFMQRRWKLSVVQRADMWNRWKAGESLNAIGRALGKDKQVIHFLLARNGGIAPPVHRRSQRVLTLSEREDISRGIASGCSLRFMAQRLGRACSTISREVARHGGRAQYRANVADQQAWQTALRPKPCLLAMHAALREIVASKLMQDWAPKQISGWLKTEYPNDESLRVSHETIYRSLFIQARGALKQELVRHLRSKRRIRRSRHARKSGHRMGQIVDAISIRERPAEVEDRAVPGHWEGDLLRGAGNSHVITLVERGSRFCVLIKVAGKDTATVVAALSQHVQQLPAALRRSLTWDRGLEMAQHKSFTIATDMQVYFCDPQSPWQRGSNENTNGLLRQYLPKTADLSRFSQSELDEIALRLNTRPRQTLGFKTPADKLQASVASTP